MFFLVGDSNLIIHLRTYILSLIVSGIIKFMIWINAVLETITSRMVLKGQCLYKNEIKALQLSCEGLEHSIFFK
jgi:hypothetical protein